MNVKITLAIVALIAAIGVSAIVTSVAQPAQAKGGHCHGNRQSFGCNPGTGCTFLTCGGFELNRGNTHSLPNNNK
jgi:hypothetical protein